MEAQHQQFEIAQVLDPFEDGDLFADRDDFTLVVKLLTCNLATRLLFMNA